MKKVFSSAPLLFMGQKRKFLKQFKPALNQFPSNAIYVDMFGGSGLLSHTVKAYYPNATVIYNDFDGYSQRLANIDKTNALLDDIRLILVNYPKDKIIKGEAREQVLERVKLEETKGYVDYITISSSILFSMNYATCYNEIEKSTLYNCVRQSNYNADGYLDGIEVVQIDYKELFKRYKDCNNVVFLVDPPYLSTDAGTYKGYWKLRNYLDVLNVLEGSNYFYFTSNKSQIVELCEWIETRSNLANPFAGASIETMNTTVNHNAGYTDIMLYKLAG
ncbi:DNA adenine methylase [Flavobacterium oreochromis]|uniref:DNA adenine methylase n=1 Tax=Flavobacterium oreochromis TaxID=2906078 RepID=UPI00385A847C